MDLADRLYQRSIARTSLKRPSRIDVADAVLDNEAGDHIVALENEAQALRAQVVDREARLLLLEEAFLERHGCFPLDRTNASQELWNDAMRASRQITGEDFGKRKARVAQVREAFLLMDMAGIYPGDPDGSISRDACELLGVPYRPVEIVVTVGTDVGTGAGSPMTTF